MAFQAEKEEIFVDFQVGAWLRLEGAEPLFSSGAPPSSKERAKTCRASTPSLLVSLSLAGLSRPCSGHGTFSPETCSCRCEQGWEGADCGQPACPGACSGHGRCEDGRCLCDEPYVGADCAHPACPGNCSGQGVCVRGVCRCHEDFTSEDCSERRCPSDCSGHGFCDTGECYCEEGFTGFDCAQGESRDALWPASLPSFPGPAVPMAPFNHQLHFVLGPLSPHQNSLEGFLGPSRVSDSARLG